MKSKATIAVLNFSYLLRESLIELLKNDPLRMAGATAFFYNFCPAAGACNHYSIVETDIKSGASSIEVISKS